MNDNIYINPTNWIREYTFKEFSDAVERIDEIDNEKCYQSAHDRFNYDIIKEKYMSYFGYINDVMNGSGFYEGL